MNYKGQAYSVAQHFESIYGYSDYYKVQGNPTVWRFMNLARFESILRDEAIYFAKPSTFEDPLEGSFSKFDLNETEENGETLEYTRADMKEIQSYSAISCWHINEYESAGMWNLYLSGEKDGVAIKTDYYSLINSIKDLRYRIFSGNVQYIDFHTDMTSKNIYDTLFFKRKSFNHENELRLMIVASRYNEYYLERLFESEGIPVEEWEEKMEELEEKSYDFSHEGGNLITCDVNKLINQVYISPKSNQDFVKKVNDLASKYKFSKRKIVQSDLYNDYLY